MIYREITLYCDDFPVPEINGNPKADYNLKSNYIEVVGFFNRFSEDFIKQHVKKIYLEYLSGDNLSIHIFFCREIAFRYDATVIFKTKYNDYIITKDTPEDWYDICEYDIMNHPNETLGPGYIDISPEEAKRGLWIANTIIDSNHSTLTSAIQGDWFNTQRNYFKNYDDFKKWAFECYANIFVNQRKMFYYSMLLKKFGTQLTQKDISNFEQKALENFDKYSKDIDYDNLSEFLSLDNSTNLPVKKTKSSSSRSRSSSKKKSTKSSETNTTEDNLDSDNSSNSSNNKK